MAILTSYLTLKYNGSGKTADISDNCEAWSYTDCATGEADTITLTLNDRDGMWRHGFYPKGSDVVKMWINTTGFANGSNKLYCGRFDVDTVTFNGRPKTAELNAIAIPTKLGFSVSHRNKTYKDTTVRNILAEIAKRAGLTLVYQASNIKVKETSQSATSDMSFAFSLCDQYGLCMKIFAKKLVAYDQTRYEKKRASFTINIGDIGEDGGYAFNQTLREVYDSVNVMSSKDGKNKVAYKFIIPGKKGVRRMIMSSSSDSKSDAQRQGKAALRKSLREARTVTLDVMGNTKYKSATTFNLTGFGKCNGKYFIDRVVHSNSGDGYRCSIEAHKVVTNF